MAAHDGELKEKGRSVHDHDKGASRGDTLEGTTLATTEISRSYREPGPGGAGSASAEPGRPLPAALLYRRCDSTDLPFELVSELEDPSGPIGQDRAVEAVEFAVQMRRKGYNIYALGPAAPANIPSSRTCCGSGRTACRRRATGATLTISPTRRSRTACNYRRGAPPGCAKR